MLSLCTASAVAQELDPALIASRRALIDRATAERRAGRHDEALELAQRAAQIQWTPSLRLFVMQEQVATGALVDAYGSALTCQSEAARDRAPSAQTIAQLCAEATSTLRAQVGRVVLRLTPAREDVQVFVGSREVPPLLLGHEYVVTPGTMLVRAQGPSIEPVEREIVVAPGASVDLELALRERPAIVASTAAPSPVTAPPVRASTPPASLPPRQAALSQRPPVRAPASIAAGPIALTSAGGVSLIVSGVVAVVAVNAISEYDQRCPPAQQHCATGQSDAARAAFDRANTSIAVSATTAVLGALAVGAGVLWFVRTPGRPERAPIAFVAPTASGATVGISGAF